MKDTKDNAKEATMELTDSTKGNIPTTIQALREEYPGLVAYDESGFPVELDCIELEVEEGNRILFWATEEASKNDDGANAVAVAKS